MRKKSGLYIILVFLLFPLFLQSQNFAERLLTPADTFNSVRFYSSVGIAGALTTGFSIGLYNTWYKQYEQEAFHLFDDWNEWGDLDKAGHSYTAYFEGVLFYKAARWTGLKKKNAILTGIIAGTALQSTIEIMDGFSAKWGFSIPDMGFNLLGSALFAGQQYFWDEQRIRLKVSSSRRVYPDDPIWSFDGNKNTSLQNRANQLFGTSVAERYLKDYNAQSIWASINISSFLPDDNQFPEWLNLAIGYSVENMFGGFENKWEYEGYDFRLDNNQFPRYQQIFVGLDVEWEKIFKKNYYLKTVGDLFNLFKLPGPAIEINTMGEVKFHLFYM